jgi:hypothetical protein
MADPKGFPSLRASLESAQSAQHATFAARAESKVAHEDAFSEMKTHILNHYRNVDAQHSFMDEGGGIFDCIPIEQQPALRGSKERVPKPPEAPPREASGREQDERKDILVESPLSPNRKDRHGNAMHCPPGTVPIRRVTLETLTRFPTLNEFFRKAPKAAGHAPRASIAVPGAGATHRWAHAFQMSLTVAATVT